MSYWSAELRSRDEWWEEFLNPEVRVCWAEEASRRTWEVRTATRTVNVNLSKRQIEYVLDELSGYAALRDDLNRCEVSCFERIWHSFSLLDAPLIAEIDSSVNELVTWSSAKASLFPNDTTNYLIDPLMHPFIYRRTLASVSDDRGFVETLIPPSYLDSLTTSPRFALLPSEVAVSESGSVRFLSYINNLHPSRTTLHESLEILLEAFIPLFAHALTDLHRNNPLRQRISGSYRYTEWDEPEPPENSDDEEGWREFEKEMEHWVANRPVQLPDVPEKGYLKGSLEARKQVMSLFGRNLQVIVSLEETELTHDQPTSPGTEWHVEGTRSERVVACGLYFLSSDHLTPAFVEFRMAVSAPRGFVAGDSGATSRSWGFEDGDPSHQYIGQVAVRQGLALVFPNIYQYRQTAFRLSSDPMNELGGVKTGKQRLVKFCLVDPEIEPILSTANVAPQQKEWIEEALFETLREKIPLEVLERIMGFTEGLTTLPEAEAHRLQLVEDLSRLRQLNNEHYFCVPFSIWLGTDFFN